MVTVTTRARQELKRLGDELALQPGKSLRLATPPAWEGEGDFGIVIADEWEGDRMVELDGAVVLRVDGDLMERMPKAVLDFKESPEGARFTLDVF